MSLERRRQQYEDHPAWPLASELQQRFLDEYHSKSEASQDYIEFIVEVLAILQEHQRNWNPLIQASQLQTILSHLQNMQAHGDAWKNGNGENHLAEVANQAANIGSIILPWPPLKDNYFKGVQNASIQFQNATSSKVQDVEEKVDILVRKLAESNQLAEFKLEEVEQVRARFAERAKEAEDAIGREVQRIDSALVDLAARYTDENTERAEKFAEFLAAKQEQFVDLAGKHEIDADNQIERLEELKAKAEELVQAVGQTATATDYGKYATEQSQTANKLRATAMTFFSGSFLWLLLGHLISADDSGGFWQHVLVRIIGAVALLGGGLYSARESSQHRQQARLAKSKQLDLKALDPFVATLPEEQRLDIKAQAARRLFVETDSTSANDISSGHPLEEVLKTLVALAQNGSKTSEK
ncbi:hypothetical protein AB0J40_41380 [Amycolatopsis sp. NPDC049691]|uniref:hypothetical protein n=1 Tax=Amycolatopsis sp. NPDC049691 TaxID=3155155 RepID=UPI00342E8654